MDLGEERLPVLQGFAELLRNLFAPDHFFVQGLICGRQLKRAFFKLCCAPFHLIFKQGGETAQGLVRLSVSFTEDSRCRAHEDKHKASGQVGHADRGETEEYMYQKQKSAYGKPALQTPPEGGRNDGQIKEVGVENGYAMDHMKIILHPDTGCHHGRHDNKTAITCPIDFVHCM